MAAPRMHRAHARRSRSRWLQFRALHTRCTHLRHSRHNRRHPAPSPTHDRLRTRQHGPVLHKHWSSPSCCRCSRTTATASRVNRHVGKHGMLAGRKGSVGRGHGEDWRGLTLLVGIPPPPHSPHSSTAAPPPQTFRQSRWCPAQLQLPAGTPGPSQTPHSSWTAPPPQVPLQSGSEPAQSHVPGCMPGPPQRSHSSTTLGPPHTLLQSNVAPPPHTLLQSSTLSEQSHRSAGMPVPPHVLHSSATFWLQSHCPAGMPGPPQLPQASLTNPLLGCPSHPAQVVPSPCSTPHSSAQVLLSPPHWPHKSIVFPLLATPSQPRQVELSPPQTPHQSNELASECWCRTEYLACDRAHCSSVSPAPWQIVVAWPAPVLRWLLWKPIVCIWSSPLLCNTTNMSMKARDNEHREQILSCMLEVYLPAVLKHDVEATVSIQRQLPGDSWHRRPGRRRRDVVEFDDECSWNPAGVDRRIPHWSRH